MKNFLMFLMILGIAAGIGAAFLGLKERTRFNIIAMEAKAQREEAVRKQQEAEEDKRYAEGVRDEAERKQRIAEREREEALNEAGEAKAQAQESDRKRQTADEMRLEAEHQRDQSLQEKQEALKKREAMAEERDEAVGFLEVEEKARRIAEQKRDEALRKMNEADQEVAELHEIGEMARKTVSFVGFFSRVLLPCIDDGDDYYIQGLTAFAAATKRQARFRAIGFVNKAREKYVEAQGKLKKVASIDDQTREIIELTQESTKENIKSIGIIHEGLGEMLRRTLNEEQRRKISDEASNRKERADRLLIEVCNKLLDVIETYKEGFTKAQQSHIQDLKKKIETRLGIKTPELAPLKER